MKRPQSKEFTAIACCTFCGRRNVLKSPLATGGRCAACGRILEFSTDIECPHCQGERITVSMGRDPTAGAFLMCSACNRQIADGIPLRPKSALILLSVLRSLAGAAANIIARILNGRLRYQYHPKLARAQFHDLNTSWRSESRAREGERQGQPRPRENDLTVYAQPGDGEQIKRSRQLVLSRHTALLDKYQHHVSTFVAIANGKVYQDEYGDEVWDAAEKEIDRLIDEKVFKRENIRDRDEFYSFEFLSRCEPAFGSEYADCWIFDELKDRLKTYHESRLRALAAGEADPDKMSGTEFEEWLIASIRRAGIVDAKPTKRTGDQGADIIVRQGRTLVIQAKCYQQSVGNAAVQEVHAAKVHYAADEAWVVTNSTFTRSARELAKSTGVRLVDRSNFRDIGLLVTQALAPEDQRVQPGPCPGECAAPPTVQDEPTEPVVSNDAAFREPARSAGGPRDPERHDLQQLPIRIVADKRRLSISALIAVSLIAGSATFVLGTRDLSRRGIEQKVRGVLGVWASTMLSNDLAGQVDCYAPTVAPFFQRPSVTLNEVAVEKERMMKKYPLMKKYEITNVKFDHVDAERAVVSFDKSWEARGSRTFDGSERQTLELRPIGGRWRITAEREHIYWVRTK